MLAGTILLHVGCVVWLIQRGRKTALEDIRMRALDRASAAQVARPARGPRITIRKFSMVGQNRRKASALLPFPPPAAQQQANVGLMAAIRQNTKRRTSHAGVSDEIAHSGSIPTPLLPADVPKVLPALDELIVTERAYVTQLETLVHGYLPELRTVLNPAETKLVFANCEILLGVNHTLLAKLSDALEAAPSADVDERVFEVAGAFLTMLPFLKAYAQVPPRLCPLADDAACHVHLSPRRAGVLLTTLH